MFLVLTHSFIERELTFLSQFLYVLVVTFAVFIQAVAGFGGTLIAMPLGILLVGVGVAKPSMTIIAWLTGLAVAIPGFKKIDWKELAIMTAVMLVGVLLGLWLFGTVNMNYLLILYAVVVFLIGVKKLFFPSNKTLPKALQGAALGIAGIMQGLFVSGGSFLVVYAVERIKEKQTFRATVNAVWALLNTVLIASYWIGGTLTQEVLTTTALCVVPTFAAVWIAGVLAKMIKQETFLKIAYVILILSGLVLLISNL